MSQVSAAPVPAPQPLPDPNADRSVSHFMWFIMILYLVEGWATNTGILQQPFRRYATETLHWDAGQIDFYLFWLIFPWVLKPLWGYISDAYPLFGYRRKSWLILWNVAGAIAFDIMAVWINPNPMFVQLMIISTAMAVSSALCGGLLVETGKSSGENTKFCSQQTLFANVANVSAALIGGWLCQYLSPTEAIRYGALMCSVGPLLVVWATIAFIHEEKNSGGVEQRQAVKAGAIAALRSGELWLVFAFLILWSFSPGFGTPMYKHMGEDLHFSQSVIGQMDAWFAFGAAMGALGYRWVSPKVSINSSVAALIIVGTVVQYGYAYMQTEPTAIALNFLNGAMTAAAGLAVHVVAANKCPKYAEGVVYGTLFAVTNFTHSGSRAIGSAIYVHYHNDINVLITFAAATTLLCLVLVPFINFSKEEGHSWYQMLRNRRS